MKERWKTIFQFKPYKIKAKAKGSSMNDVTALEGGVFEHCDVICEKSVEEKANELVLLLSARKPSNKQFVLI